MEIEEIYKKKRALELSISASLSKFEKETGLIIRKIDIDRYNGADFNEPLEISNVNMEIRL